MTTITDNTLPGLRALRGGAGRPPARAHRRAFGVPPVSGFVSTEGLAGCTEPGGAVMRFATDMCLVELVDDRNQPVPDGTASAKVLLTNLHNHTQPLIRYELTDRFIRHPAPGDPDLHAAVEGRADEPFRYGAVTINPLVIRTVMASTPGAIEYQVRQTDHGIDAAVVADGALDRAALASALRHSLHTAGGAQAACRPLRLRRRHGARITRTGDPAVHAATYLLRQSTSCPEAQP
jgi:phenylacetate-CoA ligase